MNYKELTKEELIDRISILEKESKEYKETFNLLFSSMADIYYQTNLEGKIKLISPSIHFITGYAPEELIGRSITEFYEFPEHRAKLIEELSLNGKASNFEATIIKKDGSKIVLSSNVQFKKDEYGKPTYIEGISRDITERKQSEEALQESEQKFREMTDLLPQIVFETDVNGNLTFINKKGYFTFGYSEDEVDESFNVLQTVISEDRERAKENILKVMAGKIIENTEYTVIKKDGSIFPALISSSPIIKKNKPVGLRGIIIDITDRKRAEEILRESEEKFSKSFYLSPDSISISSVKTGKLIEVNKGFENVFGYKKNEVIGRSTIELGFWTNPKDREKMIETIKRTGHVRNFEAVGKSKSGNTFIGDISSELIEINGEKCLLTIVRDITERKKVEEELRSSEERHRNISQLSSDYFYSLAANPSGKFEVDWISDSFERVTTYSLDEIKNFDKWMTHIHPDDRLELNKNNEALLDNKFVTSVYRLFTKDGETRWFSDRLMPKWDEDQQRVTNIFGAVRDITDQKIAEDKTIKAKELAEKADRLKSEFLAQMSHEIRTPINAILSFSNLLRDELKELVPEELESSFDIMDNAGQRIIRTIDLILNMSEIQTGTYTPKFRTANLFEEILIPLSTQFKPICKGKGLELIVEHTNNGSHIKCDEYTVTQIFDNLLGNAVKYTKEGKIEIIGFMEKENLIVDIVDTGVGISEEYLPELFIPFSQEEQGYTRKYEGSGLGLSLVQKYCKLNNAEIHCESQKGKGSKFRVVFSSNGKE